MELFTRKNLFPQLLTYWSPESKKLAACAARDPKKTAAQIDV
jgi:hypothetical protein